MNQRRKVSLVSLSCSEASRLASESLDRELIRRERWALWIHTRFCSACRRFIAQLRTLRTAIDAMPANLRKEWRNQALRLSVERRETIKRILINASRDEP